MNEILNDFSEKALTWAIEANLCEFYRLAGRWTRSEVHDDKELVWTITDIPFFLFNVHIRANLEPNEAETAIQAAIQRGRSRKVPICWYVGPATQPADLSTTLEKYGFSTAEPEIGMAIDIQSMHEDLPMTSDLTIEEVNNEESLLRWSQVAVTGFGMPEFTVEYFYDWFLSLGFGKQSPIKMYLGYVNGEPAATSGLFLGAGVAGIYCVATLPHARRQGIGAAMTILPLQDAREMGYRVGILQASSMGFPVYRKIGFQEYCKINLYIKEV